MKRRLLFTFILSALFSCGASAQAIGYTYDAGGNRVSREIVLDAAMMKAQDVIGTLSSGEVVIHPNPTEGMLKVEIRNFDSAKQVSLMVFTTQGQLITSQTMSSPTATIDLSAQLNGVYILQVDIDGQKTPWKIIKK